MATKKPSKSGEPDIIRETSKLVKTVTESAFVKEFSEFINRGNIMDLAIGVAVGGAFTTIVKSLVDDIIMPVASLLAGGLDFTTLAIDIPNVFGADTTAHIAYGNFLQNVVNFLIIALTVFLIVRTLNRLNAKAVAKMEAEAKVAETQAGTVQTKAKTAPKSKT